MIRREILTRTNFLNQKILQRPKVTRYFHVFAETYLKCLLDRRAYSEAYQLELVVPAEEF